MYKLIFLFGISLLISSCGFRNDRGLLRFVSDNQITYNQTILNKVSYQLINQRILIPKCISCHGDSGHVNLETYASVYSFIDKIKEVTISTRKMPKSPYSALNNEEFELLATWIHAGTPEKPLNGTDIPPPKIEPLEPTFLSIKKNIFQNKCLVCHSIGKEAERVRLDTADDLINSPLDLVLPGNPDESGLVLAILPTARKIMPPKKTGIVFLNPSEIEMIKEWIANGAKD
ncbi:MAG: hypothetical protein H7281_07595 [Bacteriovorax sp.]|nr:hypothetical protein [Bacteriovorax sp.]